MNLQVTLTPSEYNGWSLKYNESHDRKSDWQATKGEAFVSADKPDALIRAIDRAEQVTARFAKEIKVWHKDFRGELAEASIHTICENRVYFRDKSGDHSCFLSNLRPEESDNPKFIYNIPFNNAILKKQRMLRTKRREIDNEIAVLHKTLHYVTDADLLVAVKKVGGNSR